MHPDSFEERRAAEHGREARSHSPSPPRSSSYARRRFAVLATAALGLGYAGIGRRRRGRTALRLARPSPRVVAGCRRRGRSSRAGSSRRPVALTIAGQPGPHDRLLQPLWPDQVRVAAGLLAPAEFLAALRAHSRSGARQRRGAGRGARAGLEKIPHPYYIEASSVLGSYMEQGLSTTGRSSPPAALAAAAHGLGVRHVAIQLAGLEPAGDPFEASVARLGVASSSRSAIRPWCARAATPSTRSGPRQGRTALAAAATITRTDSCVLSEATTAVTPGLRPSAASDRNARLRDGVLEGAHRRSRLGVPTLVLRPLADQLPTLAGLMARGAHGRIC